MIDSSVNAHEPRALVSVNVKEFSAKYKSKKEIYGFLSGPCKAYLVGYDGVSIYYLRDIILGKKKCKCLVFQW
jgi:hypothetical protein